MRDSEIARAEDIRARIMVGNAMCSIAESEFHAGRKNGAVETLGAVHRTIKEVTALLSHPDHVSASERQDLDHLIRQLNDRMERLEITIQSSTR